MPRNNNANTDYIYNINTVLQAYKECLERSIRTSKMPEAVIQALLADIRVKPTGNTSGVVSINDVARDALMSREKANLALIYNYKNNYKRSPMWYYGEYKTRHKKSNGPCLINLATQTGRGSNFIGNATTEFLKLYPDVRVTWDGMKKYE